MKKSTPEARPTRIIYVIHTQTSILEAHLAHVPKVCQIVDRFLSFTRLVENLRVKGASTLRKERRMCMEFVYRGGRMRRLGHERSDTPLLFL